jgi:hypothetical protein
VTRSLTILWVLLLASVLVFGLCGCANTAKQDATASAEYIRSQNYAATNTPLPMNLNYNQPPPVPGVSMDSPKTVQTGFVRPVVTPITNGCSQIVWKGMTNIACPLPAVTNLTITASPGGVFVVSNLIPACNYRTSNSWLQSSTDFKSWSTVASLSDSATLAWNASDDPMVTGYNVYWRMGSNTYSITNYVSVGLVTNVTVTGLSLGTTYYFAATTYNASGLESPDSAEVIYTTPTNRPVLSIR